MRCFMFTGTFLFLLFATYGSGVIALSMTIIGGYNKTALATAILCAFLTKLLLNMGNPRHVKVRRNKV